MKRLALAAATAAALGAAPAFAATLYVPDFDSSGWQQYSYTFGGTFTGTVVLGVSDEGHDQISFVNALLPSQLLLDNLDSTAVLPQLVSNRGFEFGNLAGYGAAGDVKVVSSFDSYRPTEGGQMALLDSVDGDSGVSTSLYLNTQGNPGVDGSLIQFSISANAGDTLTFDWAFSAGDYAPFGDFAFISLVGTGPANGHYEVLAEITPVPAPVPVPAAVWLMGSGLLGLAGVARRSQQKA